MRNIFKVFAALMIFALPLSAQAKKTLPEVVKQIQQKIEKYKPAAKHNQSMTRAEVASLDSVIDYYDDVVIRKVYCTFDGEWNETAYYKVSIESDSLIKDQCEKYKVTDTGTEVINYFGHDNEWYPIKRVVSDDTKDEVAYYVYKNDDWVCQTKYYATEDTDEEGREYSTITIFSYDENGEVIDWSYVQHIKISDKLSMEVYDGIYDIEDDDDIIYPLILVYEYDDNYRISRVTYQDEYEQVLMEEVYNYDVENWDYTKITLDTDSVILDRYSAKAVGPYTAYTYEKINKANANELRMEQKVDVVIDEDGSYVVTNSVFDEDGNGLETFKNVILYDEEGNIVCQETYSSKDGEWELTSSETTEYMNNLPVKITRLFREYTYPYFTYYYYSDGTHTGVDKIAMPETQQTDQYFDLQGRPVTASANGLVVRNGKVVLIRK